MKPQVRRVRIFRILILILFVFVFLITTASLATSVAFLICSLQLQPAMCFPRVSFFLIFSISEQVQDRWLRELEDGWHI